MKGNFLKFLLIVTAACISAPSFGFYWSQGSDYYYVGSGEGMLATIGWLLTEEQCNTQCQAKGGIGLITHNKYCVCIDGVKLKRNFCDSMQIYALPAGNTCSRTNNPVPFLLEKNNNLACGFPDCKCVHTDCQKIKGTAGTFEYPTSISYIKKIYNGSSMCPVEQMFCSGILGGWNIPRDAECENAYDYYCASGYYGTATWDSNDCNNCQKCPELTLANGGSQSVSSILTGTAKRSTINTCYVYYYQISGKTFKDEYGTYIIENAVGGNASTQCTYQSGKS